MNLLIYLCVGIGLSVAAPLNEPVLMIDPTPPPGYRPGLQVVPEDMPRELGPREDPKIMIDPTPPAGYVPTIWDMRTDPTIKPEQLGYELQKDIPRELRPIVDPTRPGQYELPNQPGVMVDPTPPPGYVPTIWDMRTDPTMKPEQLGYELQKDIPRELRPIVDPTRPGQYELPNQPGVMVDPTPPPGYVPTIWDMRTDPTIKPKQPLIMIDPPHFDEDSSDDGEPYDPDFFSLNSGFADLDRE